MLSQYIHIFHDAARDWEVWRSNTTILLLLMLRHPWPASDIKPTHHKVTGLGEAAVQLWLDRKIDDPVNTAGVQHGSSQ